MFYWAQLSYTQVYQCYWNGSKISHVIESIRSSTQSPRHLRQAIAVLLLQQNHIFQARLPGSAALHDNQGNVPRAHTAMWYDNIKHTNPRDSHEASSNLAAGTCNPRVNTDCTKDQEHTKEIGKEVHWNRSSVCGNEHNPIDTGPPPEECITFKGSAEKTTPKQVDPRNHTPTKPAVYGTNTTP